MKTRKTIRAYFTNIDRLSSDDIAKLETVKPLLSENVPLSIRRAYDANQNYASVFEINESDTYLEIHKSQWIKAIETIISWYSHESVQDYEKCVELTKLISLIKVNKKRDRKQRTQKNNSSGEE